MAAIDDIKIEVGIKVVDPNWQVMCLILASNAMQALAYLESNQPELAIVPLRNSKATVELTMMTNADLSETDIP